MTTSSYITGKMLHLFAIRANGGLGIGSHADRVWGAPSELVEQSPVQIGQGVEGNGDSSIFAEMGNSLGALQGGFGSGSPFFYRAAMVGSGGSSLLVGSGLFGQIHNCLIKNGVSRIMAGSMLSRACGPVLPSDVSGEHLSKVIEAIRVSAGVFMDEGKVASMMRELRALKDSAVVCVTDRQQAEHDEIFIDIDGDDRIYEARSQSVDFAREMGFGNADVVKIATVVSELSRNIFEYAGFGTIELISLGNGIKIVARDNGPGIPHIDEVMDLDSDWRSKTGMGLGLRGSRRVMDTFDVQTTAGKGTTVIATKLLDR